MQFLNWDFSHDLSSAAHVDSAEEIRFTRAERSLLQALMSYKGRIWTRNSLLDAVSGIDWEASGRNIDFLISRLRRKLHDSARQPSYIETRYGEGYVWIAESSRIKPANDAALPPIRTRLRGSVIMSYCDRPDAERTILQQHADRALILRLQGFLYFGAANRLFEEVRQSTDRELDYLIIDFRDVVGVDDTAIPRFVRIERLAQACGFQLMFSTVRPVLESHLHSVEARRFGTLDAALEWRETKILEANPAEIPEERTLAGRLGEELGRAEAATVLQHFETFVASAETEIIRAASYTRQMFFLESGTIEVLLNVDDTWVRASRIWPGTLFGEIGFHCGGPRTATLRTVEDCRLVCMERPAVARLEADFPSLAIALHRFLARCSAARLVFYNDMITDFFRSTLW